MDSRQGVPRGESMFNAMLELILVRHGLTDWNENGRLLGRCEIGINERGRRQAAEVAQALRSVRLDGVLSSPQQRAQETAAPIAADHGLDVCTEAPLDEVWLGRWQGKTFAEIHEDPDVARLMADPMYVCDAIEPAEKVRQRVTEYVEHLREGKRARLVLVSHGDPLRLMLAHYLSMPLAAYRSLSVSNGSISILRLDALGAHVVRVNCLPNSGLFAGDAWKRAGCWQ